MTAQNLSRHVDLGIDFETMLEFAKERPHHFGIEVDDITDHSDLYHPSPSLSRLRDRYKPNRKATYYPIFSSCWTVLPVINLSLVSDGHDLELNLQICRRTRSINMIDTPKGPQVGERAPDFLIETADGRFLLNQLAAQHEKLILTSQDSYRYHPN